MMEKRYWLVVVVIVLALAGYFGMMNEPRLDPRTLRSDTQPTRTATGSGGVADKLLPPSNEELTVNECAELISRRIRECHEPLDRGVGPFCGNLNPAHIDELCGPVRQLVNAGTITCDQMPFPAECDACMLGTGQIIRECAEVLLPELERCLAEVNELINSCIPS